MAKRHITEPKDIATEQRDLSVLLCKLLYTIYKKNHLEIDRDDQSVVTAYTPDETHLYDIWRETYYDTTTYWLKVQNGERQMIEFGRRPNDGVCFSTHEHNYLEALYNLRTRQPYVKKGKKTDTTAIKTKLALANLENEKPKPDLKSFEAWDEKRIKVLLYLKELAHTSQK